MTARRLPPTLVALSPGDLESANPRAFLARAQAAIDAGLDGVLLREPEMSDRAYLDLARALAGRLGPAGFLAIHDRVHLAVAAGAHAVHLGFRSLPTDAARALLPDEIAVGLSAHAHDDPQRWSAADYLFFGPVFDTPSKAGLVASVGIEGLASASARSAVPVWAIGGLRPEHATSVLATGARGIAVRAGVFGDGDSTARVREWQRALPQRSSVELG